MATQGNFDILFGKIKDVLEAYSAAQIAAERFSVYPDFFREFPKNADIANVYLYMGDINPTKQAGQAHFEYDSTYIIDLIALGKGTQGGTYSRGDEAAGARLRILIQQVLTALFPVDDQWLGMGQGVISKKPFPSISPLPPDMFKTERPIAAARITFTPGLAWEPTPLVGDTLTAISVTADIWSALIEP